MAQFSNNFCVSGFVCNDAKVYDFTRNTLAKFGLSISRMDDSTNNQRVSAILNCEAWRKLENKWQFDKHLKKGQAITITGFFMPQEWTDQNGQRRSSVILRVTSIENTDEKKLEEQEAVPAETE